MINPEIVLIGGPNSGKTHFAGQLYGRVQRNPGGLKLRVGEGTPADISALQEVLRSLENGNSASHTSTDTWTEVKLPLVNSQGKNINLSWPDYGGEQIKEVFNTRSVNEVWRNQLIKANGWIVLIRLGSEVTYPDAMERLARRAEGGKEVADRADSWDANAYWVEKLQILLHVARIGTVKALKTPRLAILLSCYDELEEIDTPPMKVLSNKLPLLASYIRNNWTKESVSVWGLSALGQNLSSSSQSDAFIDNGPETQGWLVSPEGGNRKTDLTLPIEWIIG